MASRPFDSAPKRRVAGRPTSNRSSFRGQTSRLASLTPPLTFASPLRSWAPPRSFVGRPKPRAGATRSCAKSPPERPARVTLSAPSSFLCSSEPRRSAVGSRFAEHRVETPSRSLGLKRVYRPRPSAGATAGAFNRLRNLERLFPSRVRQRPRPTDRARASLVTRSRRPGFGGAPRRGCRRLRACA